MKKLLKRSLAIFLCTIMVFGAAPLSGLTGIDLPNFVELFSTKVKAAELVYGDSNGITRAEWLHNLVILFGMISEDGTYPDNYYPDITSTHSYYRDILLCEEYGVIDIEPGSELKPEEKLTREFAAHTLNFCLGYVNNVTNYTYSDSSSTVYPDDCQVALSRGWLSPVNGKFNPDMVVTSDEISVMLTDAQSASDYFNYDENYDSKYTFDNSVIVVPNGTEAEVNADKITINDCPVTIKSGNIFAVYINNVPSCFKALDVSVQQNRTVINCEEADNSIYIKSTDAQGIIPLTEDYEIIPADGTTVEVIEEEENPVFKSGGPRKINGKKKIKTKLKATKTINLGSGASISVNVNMNNPVIEYDISSSRHEASVDFDTDLVLSYSAKFDIAKNIPKDSLTLFTVNIFGIGSLDINLDLELSGSVTAEEKGHLSVGVCYDRTDGFWVHKSFKQNYNTLSAEASAKVGVSATLGVTDLPILTAYLYAEAGIKANVRSIAYSDGKKPVTCTSFNAYLYASAGARASVKFFDLSSSTNKEYVIFNASNSPLKVVHHYEDGKEVRSCTSNRDGGGTHYYYSNNWFYTNCGSRYSGVGWGGCSNNSMGLNGDGELVQVFDYTLDSDGNATITGYNGGATSITIPEKIDGHKVVMIGDNSFENNKTLQSVSIPDTVTEIDFYAFSGCIALTNVNLSDNIEEIGTGAFAKCSSLTSVTIPKTIKKSGFTSSGGPFYGCSKLSDIILEDGMTVIPSGLFAGCTGIRKINIPDSVTMIEYSAFKECTNLESVMIPDSVVEIEWNVFEKCSSLSEVTLSKSLESLGGSAFEQCTEIKKILIPKSLTNAGSSFNYHGPFGNCSNLKNVTFEEGTTVIAPNLFAYCDGIEKIVIPDTVTIIDHSGFYHCANLSEITLPDSIIEIDSSAFECCSSLKEVTLPKKLEKLGCDAFADCDLFESITIPKTTKVSSISTAYHGPFALCSNLKEINFESGTTAVDDYLLSYCDGLENIDIPDTVISINMGAFRNCSNLKNITIPSSVTEIGSSAFLNCTSLEKIELPESVTVLSSSIFNGCTALKEYSITGTVTSIDSKAFNNCDSLTSIDIPNGVISIGQNAFNDCDKLETVTMADSVTSLSTYAFYDCDSLKTVKLSNGLSSVPDYTFTNCGSLEEIELPHRLFDGITSIGKDAFRNDTSLKKIIIPNTVTSISSTALSYPNITVIYGCKGSYAETFANENGFKFVDITNPITGICLKDNDEEKITVTKGYTVIPEFEYLPADTTDILTLESNGTKIATIKNKNQIYGYGNGTTTVTATTSSGLTYDFTVYVHTLNSLTLSSAPVKTSYKYGEDLDLTGLIAIAAFSDGTSESVPVDEFTVSGYNPEKYGDQTVTIKWNGKSATFKVTVTDDRVKATSISVTTLPTKIAYGKGETFDGTGMIVTAYYSDGTSAPVTNYSVSAMNSLKTGTQTLTVTYTDPVTGSNYSATFDVTVGTATVTLSSISVKTMPAKTIYEIGESFNSAGLVISAKYSDGSSKDITTGFTCSGFSSATAGTNTVTVTYNGKTTTFNVNVKAAAVTLSSISIKSTPSNVNYEVGDTLNTSGLVITAKYSDGSSINVSSGFTYTPTTLSTAGTQTITVTYSGKTATFTVSVKSAAEVFADAKAAAKSELTAAKNNAKSDEAKAALNTAIANVDKATNLNNVASAKSTGLTNAANADKALADAKTSALNELGTTKTNSTSDEAKAAVDTAVANVNKATNLNSVANAKSAGLTNAEKADKALADAKAEAITALEIAKSNAKTEEEKNAIDESINKVKEATNLAAVKAASINLDKVNIKTAGAKTIDYRSIVTITATASDVPDGYTLALYVNGSKVSTGDNKSVSYSVGELKSDVNYTVKVLDKNGKVTKDSSGNDVAKDGGKITVNAGFFKKLIAFFKGLFKSLPKVEVKP